MMLLRLGGTVAPSFVRRLRSTLETESGIQFSSPLATLVLKYGFQI